MEVLSTTLRLGKKPPSQKRKRAFADNGDPAVAKKKSTNVPTDTEDNTEEITLPKKGRKRKDNAKGITLPKPSNKKTTEKKKEERMTKPQTKSKIDVHDASRSYALMRDALRTYNKTSNEIRHQLFAKLSELETELCDDTKKEFDSMKLEHNRIIRTAFDDEIEHMAAGNSDEDPQKWSVDKLMAELSSASESWSSEEYSPDLPSNNDFTMDFSNIKLAIVYKDSLIPIEHLSEIVNPRLKAAASLSTMSTKRLKEEQKKFYKRFVALQARRPKLPEKGSESSHDD